MNGQDVQMWNQKEDVSKMSLTEGQLVIGTHCLGRHSMLPLTQAQRVQLTDDHMSPSCRDEKTESIRTQVS